MANGYGPRAATARATCAVSSGAFGQASAASTFHTPSATGNAKTAAAATIQRTARPAGHGMSRQLLELPGPVVADVLGYHERGAGCR